MRAGRVRVKCVTVLLRGCHAKRVIYHAHYNVAIMPNFFMPLSMRKDYSSPELNLFSQMFFKRAIETIRPPGGCFHPLSFFFYIESMVTAPAAA